MYAYAFLLFCRDTAIHVHTYTHTHTHTQLERRESEISRHTLKVSNKDTHTTQGHTRQIHTHASHEDSHTNAI